MNLKPLVFILFFGLIIWPANYLAHYFTPVKDTEFSDVVLSDEFRMGLYGNPRAGCVSLGAMKNLDIVVVGNSHVYSGVDSYVLSQMFPNDSVGVCSFAFWNLDTFETFIAYLESLSLNPKKIIWFVDIGSLIDHQQASGDVESIHHSFFFDDVVRAKELERWRGNLSKGKPVLGLSKEDYFARIERHESKLRKLDLTKLNQILNENELTDGIGLKAWFEKSKFLPNIEKKMRRVCSSLAQRGIELSLVSQAIPKQSYSLVLSTNVDKTYINAGEYFQQNLPCVKQYIQTKLEDGELDARYFLNRYLDDDYNYSLLADPENFPNSFNGMSARSKGLFFDYTHLNPVGAARHTKMWAERIK